MDPHVACLAYAIGKLGEGRVDATAAMIFSADDTLDVGEEGG